MHTGLRDLEDQKKAKALRSVLDQHDVVRKVEERRKNALEVSPHQDEDCDILRCI